MPYRPATPCAAQGCPALVRGRRWCDAHRPARARPWDDDRRGTSRERGYSKAWERASKAHLAREPLCRWCQEDGRVMPADLVDHITPLSEGGALLDPANWQSLCRSCHGVKTAWDKRREGRLRERRAVPFRSRGG